MQRKKTTFLLLALILLLFLLLSCNFVTSFLGNSEQFEDGLVQNYHPVTSPVSQYTLSTVQQAQVDEYGYPDRFVIFFFDEMLPDGQLYPIRHESWYYDARGYEIVFRNGDKFTERNGAPIQIDGLGRTVYAPQGFTPEMNLDALLNIRGETGFFVQNVDDNLITGELIFIQGLAAGFEDGRLSYVETLPLNASQPLDETPPLDENPSVPEILPSQGEVSGGLTSQELSNKGRHIYETSCTLGDESVGSDWSEAFTFEFIEGGVNWTFEDANVPLFFKKTSINTYGSFDDGEGYIITFTDEGVWQEFDDGSKCTSLKLDNEGGLTPQESASQGTHTYLWACAYSEGADTRGEINTWKTTFDFIEGGVNFSGEDGKVSFYSQTGANTYEAFHDVFHSTIIFTNKGFILEAVGTDLTRRCEVSRK